MRPQVVSECEVALDLWRVRLEKVKLDHADSPVILESAIPSSRDPQLAVPLVPQRLNMPAQTIELCQISHERHQIDDRLGSQARHRRGADVVDIYEGGAECLQAIG